MQSIPTQNKFLSIKNPDGTLQTINLSNHFSNKTELSFGSTPDDPAYDVCLSDPSLTGQWAKLHKKQDDSFWLSQSQEGLPFEINGVRSPQFEWRSNQWVKWGESQIKLSDEEEHSEGLQTKWKTQTPEGVSFLNRTKLAAQSNLSLFIHGESGTGKELLAEHIHLHSAVSKGPFVTLHCGALPSTLIESDLFGHQKGAYTGADRSRAGALWKAQNGTLFLDEIGDLPLNIQVKFLRFLENGEIRPLGSDQTLYAKVRIICASHKSLRELVSQGLFRQDLYFRLASFTLEVPTLRDRPKDVVFLARSFAQKHGKTISFDVFPLLKKYSWPGNVRELMHMIDRASALCAPSKTLLTLEDFPSLIQTSPRTFYEKLIQIPSSEGKKMPSLIEMEKHMLIRALEISHGHRKRAARILGVSRSTVFQMLKRHGLKHKTLSLIEPAGKN